MQNKAANLTFPFRKDGTGNTPVMYIACTTTHAAIDVTQFAGKFVKLLNESTTSTDFVDFFLTCLSTAEVDRTIASSSSGAQSPKLGDRLYGTQSLQGRLPYLPATSSADAGSTTAVAAKLYLIVESSASLNLRLVQVEQ